MPAYYVHIPNTEAPTAEVEASNTKHARTTYLDYLSRNNLIGWNDRQLVRDRIHIQRVEPGQISTQIQLDYTAYSPPEQEIEPPEDLEGFTPEHATEYGDEEYAVEEPSYEREYPVEPPPPPPQTRRDHDPFGGSPIVDLSRRTGGI